MRLTHDDKMRALRASGWPGPERAAQLPGLVHKTPTRAAGVSAPARIARVAINRAMAQRRLWRQRSAGGMRGLLALSRTLHGLK